MKKNMDRIEQELRKKEIEPDTSILPKLLKANREQKRHPLGMIRSLFTIRIPVYQPLILATLVIVSVYIGKSLPDKPTADTHPVIDNTNGPAYSTHVKEYLEMVKGQRIGLNLDEDTTLAGMFVKAR